MAGSRVKSQAIGSSEWIEKEREQSAQFVDQEVEEFSYSVRNELEWLNEHMGEMFSKNQVNFADVFKTPGKLRGKTPRTARKQNILGVRQPLTDIFAPNVPAPRSAQKIAFFDKVAQFQIPEDVENQPSSPRPTSRGKSPQRIGKPGNTDSGYHGMTEDEMDIDSKTETATTSSQQSVVQKVPLRENQPPPQRIREGTADATNSSDDSFMSAREDTTIRNASKEQLRGEEEGDNVAVLDDEMDVDQATNDDQAVKSVTQESEAEPMDHDHEMDAETSRSLSDASASSPAKPLQRKSSFTFTALPPRPDPLTAKRSIGNRNSHIDAQTGRGSVLGRSFGAKSVGVAQDDEAEYSQEKPEESKAHNKSSTRLLHERINLLGKKKSIPQNVLSAQAVYPQLPGAEAGSKETIKSIVPVEDDDDDWIAPAKPLQGALKQTAEPNLGSPARPGMHQKSISTTNIPSPLRPEMAMETRQQKAFSVSNPSFANAAGELQSTTPAGSPITKKSHDGPLSASKSKLYSVLKSAKNIFASSASASAAAKLEAHNSSPSFKSPFRNTSDESKTAAVFNMPGALYSERQLPQSPTRPMSVISASPSRKTRSSNESEKKREKELKAQQKAADELEKAREKERQKAAKEREQKMKAEQAEAAKREKAQKKQAAAEAEQRPASAGTDPAKDAETRPTSSKSMLPAGKLRAPGRPMKPSKEPLQPARPAHVPIRMPSQVLRPGQVPSSSNLQKSQHESNAAPSAIRPPPANRPGSAQGGQSVPNNARKALEAAARKKEADEKAAQRKAEQKREMDRKRTAKAEEERRVEEDRKAAELQRVQEVKLAAQRRAEQQAAETKRREQMRLELQRQQEEAQKAKAAHELAEAIKRERAQQHPLGDVGGTLRQLAAKNVVVAPEQASAPVSATTMRTVPQPNPAKPAKRIFSPDEDEQPLHHPQAPQRPGLQRGPNSHQQNDAKRRRTNEEEQGPPEERHSVMAPPKRPSNMRKESGLLKFPHGYAHAPPPANHHPASMLVKTVKAQHNLHHPANNAGIVPTHPSQMVQVSNAPIPFAEIANPPGQQSSRLYAQQAQGSENMQPGGAAAQNSKFKTPGRPAHAPKSAKSSPLYPNGDNIQLPEIATDSEDEDSEDEDDNTGFRAPSWVASPALRDLLTQQQLVDPETVFGPIGELKMDEVFRNGKNADRLKRLRDRGSSAAWVQTGDAVTSAEKRRDMEMRERVVKDGGWRYEPDV